MERLNCQINLISTLSRLFRRYIRNTVIMTLKGFIETVGTILGILTIPVDALHTLLCGIIASLNIILIIIWALFHKDAPFYMLNQTYFYRHSFGIKSLHDFFFLASKIARRLYY